MRAADWCGLAITESADVRSLHTADVDVRVPGIHASRHFNNYYVIYDSPFKFHQLLQGFFLPACVQKSGELWNSKG
jgi:hypothetical protein